MVGTAPSDDDARINGVTSAQSGEEKLSARSAAVAAPSAARTAERQLPSPKNDSKPAIAQNLSSRTSGQEYADKTLPANQHSPSRKRRRVGSLAGQRSPPSRNSILRTLEHLKADSLEFCQISELDDRVELFLRRRQQEVRELLGRHLPTLDRVIRLYIVTTRERLTANGDISCVFRLVGTLLPLPNAQDDPLFTQLFRRVELTTERDGRRSTSTAEWSRPASDDLAAHGVELTRYGLADAEYRVRIVLYPEQRFDCYQLSDALARLIGSRSETRSGVFMSIWQYIRINNLQSGEDNAYIQLDARLRNFLAESVALRPNLKATIDPNAGYIRLAALFDAVRVHIRTQTFEFTYNVQLSPESKSMQRCYDIPLEVEDQMAKQLANAAGLYGGPEKLTSLIQSLAKRHQEALELLVWRRRRKEFYQSFAMDPGTFTQHVMLSQTRDLAILDAKAGGPGPDDTRRASFYRSRWLHDAVPLYLLCKSGGAGTATVSTPKQKEGAAHIRPPTTSWSASHGHSSIASPFQAPKPAATSGVGRMSSNHPGSSSAPGGPEYASQRPRAPEVATSIGARVSPSIRSPIPEVHNATDQQSERSTTRAVPSTTPAMPRIFSSLARPTASSGNGNKDTSNKAAFPGVVDQLRAAKAASPALPTDSLATSAAAATSSLRTASVMPSSTQPSPTTK